MSRQTIAVSVKASKLTARALAYVVAAVGRKIAKEHRKAQTPHGKQSVRKLMGHGGDTNAIELDTPKLFDKVARKWGVDYAIRRVGDEKYLLLFKARQADAITGCFAEYSRLELKRAKSRQTPIREQLRQAEEQVKKQPQRELTKEAAHMRDMLENLYFGNITPNDQNVRSGTALKKAMEQSAECEEKLTALLEDKEKTLLLRLINAENEIGSTMALENFILGFRLGVRMILESLDGDDGSLIDQNKEE